MSYSAPEEVPGVGSAHRESSQGGGPSWDTRDDTQIMTAANFREKCQHRRSLRRMQNTQKWDRWERTAGWFRAAWWAGYFCCLLPPWAKVIIDRVAETSGWGGGLIAFVMLLPV